MYLNIPIAFLIRGLTCRLVNVNGRGAFFRTVLLALRDIERVKLEAFQVFKWPLVDSYREYTASHMLK